MYDLTMRLNALREKLGFPQPSTDFALLDDAQFTNLNVQMIAEVTQTQLHNWTSRGWINLSGDANPGKGRRRFYTGKDVLAVRLAAEMAPFSMMQVARQIYQSTGWLSSRATELVWTEPDDLGRKLFVVMHETDWQYIHDSSALPEACPVYLTIEMDLLIVQTLERLVAIVDEEEIGPLGKPMPPSANKILSEVEDFYCVWATDQAGNKVRTGLTVEETAGYEPLEAAYQDYLTGHDGTPMSHEDEIKFDELKKRHVKAAYRARITSSAAKYDDSSK